MKKTLSLAIAAFFAMGATAQFQQLPQSPVNVSNDVKVLAQDDVQSYVEVIATEIPVMMHNKTLSANKIVLNAAGENDALFYGRPQGAFYSGFTPGLKYYPNPIMYGDLVDMVVPNYSNVDGKDTLLWMDFTTQGVYYAWDYNEKKPIDLPLYMSYAQEGGMYNVPALFTANSNAVNEEDFILDMYWWGNGNGVLTSRIPVARPMTTCPMYNDEGQFDYVCYTTKEGGYLYGSNYKFQYDEAGSLMTVDTMIVVFDNMTNLWMDSLCLPILSTGKDKDAVIPANTSIKFDIIPVQIEGHQYNIASTPVASFNATQADLLYNYNSTNGAGIGSIELAFGSKNAFGAFTPQPIVMKGGFAVMISGFSQNGVNFGMLTERSQTTTTIPGLSQTFHKVMGNFTNQVGLNIALAVNGKFVSDDETAVEDVVVEENGVQKVVRDGQVLIIKGDKVYNILGAEVK